jgi:hypothetical protein
MKCRMSAEEARSRPTRISRNRTYLSSCMAWGVRHEVLFWVGLSSQWLNATHLKIFSMQENENGLSRAPTRTTNAKPSSQIFAVPWGRASLARPCHAEPPTLSVMSMSHHIAPRREKCRLLPYYCTGLRTGAALGRSRVRRNRRLMSGCQRTRETGMHL